MSRQQGRLRSPTPLAGSARFAMQYPLMTTVTSPVGKPLRGHQACNFRVSGHEFARLPCLQRLHRLHKFAREVLARSASSCEACRK